MSNAVLAPDVTIEFYKEGDYRPFGCATNIRLVKSLETKETKTLGDGKNHRVLGQSITRTITLSGVLVIDDSSFTAFDLDEYMEQMVDVQFRITYLSPNGELRVIEGVALVTNLDMGGGADGFGEGEFSLQINGPVHRDDSLSDCDLTVEDLTNSNPVAVGGGNSTWEIHITEGGTGEILKWEYSVDGSGWLDATTNPFSYTTLAGSKEFTIRPVCENGAVGEEFTKTLNF